MRQARNLDPPGHSHLRSAPHRLPRRGGQPLLDGSGVARSRSRERRESVEEGKSLGGSSSALRWPGPKTHICVFYALFYFVARKYWDVRSKSALVTYCAGWTLLATAVIVLWSGGWYRRSLGESLGNVTKSRAFVRWLIVYAFGASAVCLWHGIWYWADAWILPAFPAASYWTTSLAGSTAAFLVCGGNSLLAPPAIFLIDGPGHNPPPDRRDAPLVVSIRHRPLQRASAQAKVPRDLPRYTLQLRPVALRSRLVLARKLVGHGQLSVGIRTRFLSHSLFDIVGLPPRGGVRRYRIRTGICEVDEKYVQSPRSGRGRPS
jgi:hypothetical protein